MNNNLDIELLKKIYYNTIDMLKERNYNVKKYYKKGKIIKISDEDILKIYNNDKLIIKKEDKQDVCVYFFYNKIGINETKVLFNKIKKENINHVILVIKDKITSYAKKEMKVLSKGIEKEIFYFNNLIFNITKHELVPKHVLLNKKETELFIKNIGKKIPHIKINDPICKFYNGKIDQIFKIYREKEIYYRIVVP